MNCFGALSQRLELGEVIPLKKVKDALCDGCVSLMLAALSPSNSSDVTFQEARMQYPCTRMGE